MSAVRWEGASVIYEDYGVIAVRSKIQLIRVQGKPKKGQYAFNEQTGEYTFPKSMRRTRVEVTYRYPAAIVREKKLVK